MPYNGANLFVIGARVGINTDTPYAALDVVGNIMMRSILTPGFSILSADSFGNLLTSGSLSSIIGEQRSENLSMGVLSYMG